MDILKDSPLRVFIYNALPAVLGMLAISSAGIVDGYFLGNYVGSTALASVNLVIPVINIMFGIGLMLSVGGAVVCGKYIGENRIEEAGAIFSRTLISVVVICGSLALTGLIMTEEVVGLLGANSELRGYVADYFRIVICFTPFMILSLCLSAFIRVDEKPVLASVSIVSGAVLNIALDWVFIVNMEMGVEGAAYATGTSYFTSVLILIYPALFRGKMVKLRLKGICWKSFMGDCFNGMSEFVNEISVAIVVLVFNLIVIKRMGTAGVAAFTVINYLLFVEMIIVYGISDAMQPVISTNFGAKDSRRIGGFMKISIISSAIVSAVAIVAMFFFPQNLASLFLKSGEKETLEITLQFMKYLWPVFIFNGVNVLLSGYLTSVHKALPSAAVAVSRSLVLPVSLLMVLPSFLGDKGLYLSFPIAELVTFILAVILFIKFKPERVCSN